jgi:hypothetical protein
MSCAPAAAGLWTAIFGARQAEVLLKWQEEEEEGDRNCEEGMEGCGCGGGLNFMWFRHRGGVL